MTRPGQEAANALGTPDEPAASGVLVFNRKIRLKDADVLAEVLRIRGLTERELARQAGLGHSTVNHLLTGRRDSVLVSTADAIEAALNASGLFVRSVQPG